MDDGEASKRAHIFTGFTPSKPSEKKWRTTSTGSPSSRKSLFIDEALASRGGTGRTSKRLSGVRVVSSPLKRLSFPPVPSKSKPKAWTFTENQALIEYVALFSEDDQNRSACAVDWRNYGEHNLYWSKMADYIQETSECNVLRSKFCKRMDPDLPFYYWTLNERYSEDAYPSFDARPDFDEDEVELRNHPLRLHRLRHNQREDSAIFVVGRAHLPARDRQSIRQSFHRLGIILHHPQMISRSYYTVKDDLYS